MKRSSSGGDRGAVATHAAAWLGLSYFVACLCGALTGCVGVGGVWTGANLIYDRHHVYKQIDDFQLGADVKRALYTDQRLRGTGCLIVVAVLNGDVLVAGHVPTQALREAVYARIDAFQPTCRRLFKQVSVGQSDSITVEDTWITAQIRSQLMMDASIDPRAFKVVTVDSIVYLMGDVFPEQAAKVIDIARQTDGVRTVVKLFRYYALSALKPS